MTVVAEAYRGKLRNSGSEVSSLAALDAIPQRKALPARMRTFDDRIGRKRLKKPAHHTADNFFQKLLRP